MPPNRGRCAPRERAWRDGQLYKMHLFCITACCDTIKVNFVSVRTSVASDGSPRAVIARKRRVRDRTSANEPTPARVVRGRRRMRGRLCLLYSVCLTTFFPPGLDKCHPLWYNADRLYGWSHHQARSSPMLPRFTPVEPRRSRRSKAQRQCSLGFFRFFM